jgi:ABC-type cobalamin transport system permease subunit
MSGKLIAGIVGGLVGVGVVFGAAFAFFNSKKMKMKRAIGKAGNTMYSIGSLLCGMSTLLAADGCERT